MKVKCTKNRLSGEDISKYQCDPSLVDGNFGIEPGQEFVVFGIYTVYGRPWVLIPFNLKYLVPAPLSLFEIIDGSLSRYWFAGLDDENELVLGIPSILKDKYYVDQLQDGDIVRENHFKKLLILMESEADADKIVNEIDKTFSDKPWQK